MQAKLRRLAPLALALVVFAFAPYLARNFFPEELPAAMPSLHAQPLAVPGIQFKDAAGQTKTLADFRGSYVLLNVWATWCTPCKQEMPSLNALAANFPPKDLAIVPMSIDVGGDAAVNRYYRDFKLDRLAIYADPASKAMHALGVVAIPTTLLIDRDGKEIARQIGPAQWDSPAIVEGLGKIVGR